MDWKTKHADKLMAAADAAKIVHSGQSVYLGMFASNPEGLATALLARAPELTDVNIYHYVAPFLWATPETQGHFKLHTAFSTPADRKQVHMGMAEYQPIGVFRESYINRVLGSIDIVMVKTSPPDELGYMSYGSALWINRTACNNAPTIICEVDDRLIRTYGENFLHVSEVAGLVEHQAYLDREPPIPPRTDEVVAAAEVICTLVASELVHDGDTLQVGIGDVTAAMALYLGDKHDLGMQTELIPGGVIDLVEQGVITGRHKQIAPGKVVGSAFAVLPREELARAHMNPKFELWTSATRTTCARSCARRTSWRSTTRCKST